MERQQDYRRYPRIAAALGTLILTGACSSAPDAPGPKLQEDSDRPRLNCTSAKYINSFNPDAVSDYIVVRLTNIDSGERIDATDVRLRGLDGAFQKQLTLEENRADIEIPTDIHQVGVQAIVGSYRYACPTIVYPHRETKPPADDKPTGGTAE